MVTATSRIDEFRERLQTLYTEVSTWLWGSDMQIKEVEVVVREEELGDYSITGLEVTTTDGTRIAEITPAGIDIIGAEGQIRIVGPYDERMVTYFVDGGPEFEVEVAENETTIRRYTKSLLTGVDEPGWYLISDPRTGQTRKLDADSLLEIFREVSDYGV